MILKTRHPNAASEHNLDLPKRENISCPLCKEDKSHQKYQIKSWTIVQCTRCQFVYVNPRLQKEELLKIYTSNYFNNRQVGYYRYTESKKLRKKNFQKWITDTLPYFEQHASVKALDVGCAAGYCLEVFQEQQWKAYGVELDKDFVYNLQQKGFTIFNTPLTQLNTTEKFDLISLFDVVEHLTDLQENMAILRSLLKDSGVIVFITPNYESWQRKLFQKKWFQFKPVEHISYFSKKTLQRLANDNGFEIAYSKASGQFCDMFFLGNRLKKYGFHFLHPLFRITVKLFNLQNKSFYVDTASLYVILKKKQPYK